MKTETKNINSTKMNLKVIVEKTETTKLYNDTVKYFKNNYAIHGFRKGKAPIAMIKKLYGDVIESTFAKAATDEYFEKGLAETNLNPIDEPQVISSNWTEDKEYEIVFEFEIIPKIDIVKYKDLDVEYMEYKLADDMINGELEKLQNDNAFEEESEDFPKENDLISFSLSTNEDEKDSKTYVSELLSESDFSKKFCDEIKKHKVGDKFKSLFGQNLNGHEEIDPKEYFVVLNAVETKILPELNDDFAKDLDYESLDALKKTIATELSAQFEQKNYENKITAIKLKIIENNPFDIPQSLIERYSEELATNYVQSKEQIKEISHLFNNAAEFNFKSFMIQDNIIKKEKLEINDNDTEKFIDDEAKRLNLATENYKELYKTTIESEKFKDSVLVIKYEDFLIASNKLTPKAEESTETKEQEKIDENEEKVSK